MLFKEAHLKGIRAGTVTLAFRRWERSAVKKGSLQKTSIGLVSIADIAEVAENAISEQDAADAGFENRRALLDSLRENPDGRIFRLEVRYHSEDPRIALREQDALTPDALGDLNKRLARLDNNPTHANWTLNVLGAIAQHPRLRAVDLARLTGYEKEWLKLNIRKLKNLGLTISHEVGYEISPLGQAYLDATRS
nr:hypothetical protein [uncultured Dyadobacter sp.]